MKKAMIAASIVGAAAAGVIVYLTRKNGGVKGLLNKAESAADSARQMANRHLRKSQERVNTMVNDSMA
ncbi:hypothetical protein L3C95_16790 [Chitinophaga filiformis]|uniref:hypothetical protein n=1 Tax=Chitinophaga filiformis TaxID=104663 RepID=UPI001F302605|nr:hypothetical protein [Chitinophaga filiformis]MCF6404556.1 hypothetical protein [Chitinophaga filiformis]